MSYGFCSSGFLALPAADQQKEAAGIKAAGATYVRISLPWGTVETAQGVFSNMALITTGINTIINAGLKPLVVLDHPIPQSGFWIFAGNAAWATPAEYGNFCATIVKAFPQVTDYELWNEPNLLSFFNPVDPVAFAPYLKAGYSAAKKANPSAHFALGGLAAALDYTGFVSSWSPLLFGVMKETAQPSHYLAGLYAAGCKGFFDAVAYHPYVANPSTGVPMEPLPTHPSLTEFANLRAVMTENQDATMEIWPTEWGYSTGTAVNQVTPATQAAWLVEQAKLMATIPLISHSCPFSWRNMSASTTDVNSNFGVVDWAYNPKPALAALAGVLK